MKRIIILLYLILVAASCRDAVGPAEGDTPEGSYVVWLNGLSGFADAYFIQENTLITNAWSTGQAPNQILSLGNNTFAVLSSLSADIRFFSGENTGTTAGSVILPDGSNPWSFAICDGVGYATLLLTDSVAVFDATSFQITGSIPANSSPSGIACSGQRLFVSHANYPDASSPGGVSVINIDSGELIQWIDTGENTHWLKLQPTGMLHCYSTTYQNDGKISIVNPATLAIEAVIQSGGAPGEGVQSGNFFLSPDGWGSGGIVKYNESGLYSRIDLPVSPANLAISGNTIYATSFAANMIYLLDSATFMVVDSLQAGGEGPQGIIAVDPSN